MSLEAAQPSHSCANLPKTKAAFFNPTSNTSGAGSGRVNKPYEYGDCEGQVDYSSTKLSNGYSAQVGF